jgi:hypothetical protein
VTAASSVDPAAADDAGGLPPRFLRSSMANYGVSAATAISTLLLTPFLISRLGAVAFGVYALASTVVARMLAGHALWPLLFPCAVLGGAAFALRSVAGHSLAGLVLAVVIASGGYLISYIAVAASPRERLFLRRLIRSRAAP